MGAFPPLIGGVASRNEMLFNSLSSKLEIIKINKSELGFKTFGYYLHALLSRRNGLILGIGSNKRQKQFIRLLSFCNGATLARTTLFVAGGRVHEDVRNDVRYKKALARTNGIFVESKAMCRLLEEMGLQNVHYYPNCRIRPSECLPVRRSNGTTVKCLFFSQIYPEKGVDTILEIAPKLKSVSIDFYGPLLYSEQDDFYQKLESSPNVRYLGEVRASEEDVYALLNQYDVLVLPTRSTTEGVPGVLVESKIAAITAVAGAGNCNREVINDGVDGLILNEATSEELLKALSLLEKDREYLLSLKQKAQKSAEAFYLDCYIDMLVRVIEPSSSLKPSSCSGKSSAQ